MDDQMCRTCLLQTDNLTSIFEVKDVNNQRWKISYMLFACTEIEITIKDNLSHRICEFCIEEIIRSFVFRKKCYDASFVLKMKRENIDLRSEDLDTSFSYGDGNESDTDQTEAADPSNSILNSDVKPRNNYDEYIIEYIDDAKEDINIEQCDEKLNLAETKESTFEDMKEIANETTRRTLIRKIICPVCSKSFSHYYKLKRHEEIHKDTFDYLCNYCGEKLKTKNTYRDHLARHDTELYGCKYCGKCFASNYQLKSHSVTHTGEKPFKCKICGAAYSQKTTLKIHLRKHTGETPYKCKLCDEEFIAVSYLRKHEVRHLGPNERPFTCSICTKSFRTKENYNKHFRIHSGKRPGTPTHKCPHCNKIYAYRRGLVVHLRSHTGVKPHICNICDKAFSQKHCLQSHLSKLHREEIETLNS